MRVTVGSLDGVREADLSNDGDFDGVCVGGGVIVMVELTSVVGVCVLDGVRDEVGRAVADRVTVGLGLPDNELVRCRV